MITGVYQLAEPESPPAKKLQSEGDKAAEPESSPAKEPQSGAEPVFSPASVPEQKEAPEPSSRTAFAPAQDKNESKPENKTIQRTLFE